MNTNIKKKIKEQIKPAVFPEVDIEEIERILEDPESLKGITHSSTLKVSYLSIQKRGIIAILSSSITDEKNLLKEVNSFLREYKLYRQGVYTFAGTPGGWRFITDGGAFIIEDIYDCLDCLQYNLSIPKTKLACFDEMTPYELVSDYIDIEGLSEDAEIKSSGFFIPSIPERVISDLHYMINEKKSSAEEDPDFFYDEEGVRYEKHAASNGIWGLKLFEAWYPVTDEDPDRFFMTALIGGIFGAHKFKAHQFGQGLFYLLTVGGLGVFYILDLISIISGTYYINQVRYVEEGNGLQRQKLRIYMGKPSKRLLKLPMIGCAALLCFLYIRFGYLKAAESVVVSTGEKINAAVESAVLEGAEFADEIN